MHPKDIERVFGQTDRELWLLTSQSGNDRGGMIVSSVVQVSIVPHMPRVAVSLAKYHHTTGLVQKSQRFALHLLGARHLDWVWHFGLQSGVDHDKLAGLPIEEGTNPPRLKGIGAWIDCRVEVSLDIGDCYLYVANVVNGQVKRWGRCLTTQGLMKLASNRRKKQLTMQYEQDSKTDAAAIRAWRRARRRSDGDLRC